MTEAELFRLADARREAWRCLGRGGDDRPQVEAFRAADRAIVAELRTRAWPAAMGARRLYLTADRLNFVECDEDGMPVDIEPNERKGRRKFPLWDYRRKPASGRGTPCRP